MVDKDILSKIYFFFNLFIRITLIIAIFFGAYEREWMIIFVSLITFMLTFLPFFVEKKYKINLPPEIEMIIILFIYAGIFLGEVRDFYYKIWWWDSMLHLSAGISLGFAGFLILYVFYKTGKFKASPAVIAFFTFCFALALGALWEIFEYYMDNFFALNMQKARNLELVYGYFDTRIGVIDTMRDLILDSIGAFIVSICGYIYLKKGEIFLFEKLVRRFERENKTIFRRKRVVK
ncbi:MAG: hypothetical protein ABH804_01690 [archaeon]